MRNPKNWLWFFLFGSLWGINEVVTGEVLSQNNVPHYSVFLAVIAFFILAIARGIINKPGSSTIIGIFAVLFKFANTAPFYCHLLGIFMMGLVFDLFFSLLMKDERRNIYRSSLTGVLSAYSGNALFALIITYIVRSKYWTVGGLPKVLDHIFLTGSLAAVLAAVAVPIGFRLGVNGGMLTQRSPRWTTAGTLVSITVLWILVRFFS
jgi:hypothetical protein